MSAHHEIIGFPSSMLDTDLYKLTMQQAVRRHFPEVHATYRFRNRDEGRHLSKQCFERFEAAVACFSSLALTSDEQAWLAKACPYLRADYLDYLFAYRFKPSQVTIRFDPVTADGVLGNINIEVTGPWAETILWEVPLMACLSEIYFHTDATDWSYDGQAGVAYEKGKTLLTAGCMFSEFGTRRRRSFLVQDVVVEALIRAARDHPEKGRLVGTSNPYLAKKYGIPPIGTIAHEWFMGIAALRGYEQAHSTALALWETVYPDSLLLALTDTFSTKAFFAEFAKDPERARRWKGLRQDSGDPYAFAPLAKSVYQSMGIDHREKMIVFSDALDVDLALGLRKQCGELGFIPAFGIGTSLTNDFKTLSSGGTEKSKALNIVIKIDAVDGKPCVKISDDMGKNTGDPAIVRRVKEVFGLTTDEASL